MKVKRFLAWTACAAFAVLATSAANAANPTATITVKWNTQSVNTLTTQTDYTVAAGVATGGTAAVTSYFLNNNGGTGTCGTPAAITAGTVDFLSVTPDVTTKYTDCYFKNAVNVHAFTTDGLGYAITVAGTLPKSASAAADVSGGPYKLCEISSGAWANNTGAADAVNSNFALANAPALDNGANTCATAGTAVNAADTGITIATTAGTGGTVLASQANATGSNGADFSGDIELGIPPLAAAYASVTPASVTVTYTMALN